MQLSLRRQSQLLPVDFLDERIDRLLVVTLDLLLVLVVSLLVGVASRSVVGRQDLQRKYVQLENKSAERPHFTGLPIAKGQNPKSNRK